MNSIAGLRSVWRSQGIPGETRQGLLGGYEQQRSKGSEMRKVCVIVVFATLHRKETISLDFVEGGRRGRGEGRESEGREEREGKREDKEVREALGKFYSSFAVSVFVIYAPN